MRSLFDRFRTNDTKIETPKICYIHKIALIEIKESNPNPYYGKPQFRTYRCPMCQTTIEFENEKS